MGRFRLRTGLVLGLLFALASWASPWNAKEGRREPGLADFQIEVQTQITKENYSHGLTIASLGLARFPKDPHLRYGEAICLSGLHRYQEAVDLLEPLSERHPQSGDYRFLLADCLFYAGKVDLALQEWARFYPHPLLGEKAYSQSVKALIARGQEGRARDLLREAEKRMPRLSEDLLRYQLDLEPSAPAALEVVRQLRLLDPKDEKGYAALEALYTGLGDRTLFQEVPLSGAGGTTIPLDIFSDPREFSEFGLSSGEMILQREPPRPLLTCSASLNGAPPERMMLDTGCPMLFLSPTLAEKLSLRALASSQYRGITGGEYRKSVWVVVDEIQIGPFTLRNVPAIVPSGPTGFWDSISGIVPISLFKRHAVLYDPAAPSLTLFPSGADGASILGEDEFKVPTLWLKGCPFAQARVQDGEGVFLMVDTGSFSTFLSRTTSASLTVQTPPPGSSRQTQLGLSGRFTYAVAHDVRFCFGRNCAKLSTVQVAPIALQFGIPPAGLMGRDLLDRYLVFMDYQANALHLKARKR